MVWKITPGNLSGSKKKWKIGEKSLEKKAKVVLHLAKRSYSKRKKNKISYE